MDRLYWRLQPYKDRNLARPVSFRRLAHAGIAILFIGSLVVLNIALLQRAGASSAYSAADVLGQRDNSDNPVFSRGYQQNTPSPNDHGMHFPTNSALDTVSHHLYITDQSNNRIMMFDLNSSNLPVDTIADYVIGQTDFNHGSCNRGNGPSTPAADSLCNPGGIAVDTVGHHLYVIDSQNARVLMYNLDNSNVPLDDIADAVVGKTNFTQAADTNCQSDATTTASRLCEPVDLALDTSGHHLYVADASDYRVVIFNLDSSNAPVDGTADYVLGKPDFTTGAFGGCFNTSGATAASLCNPTFVGLDDVGHHLYVSDQGNHRILIYNLDSANAPLDGTADFVMGQSNFSNGNCNNSPPYDATLQCGAGGLTIDTLNHRLFTSDSGNRELIFNLNASNLPLDGTADYVIGQPDFTSPSCNQGSLFASANSVCSVGTVALDGGGHHLYLSDSSNNRVLIYNLDNTNAPPDGTADSVLGEPDFAFGGDNGLIANATGLAQNAAGTAIDSVHHHLYVADTANGRVVIHSLDSNNHLVDGSADYVLGSSDFTNSPSSVFCNGGPVDSEMLCNPTGIAIDTVHHQLFVNDSSDQRILVFNLDSNNVPIDKTADYELGQADFSSNQCNRDGNFNDIADNTLCNAQGLALDTATSRLYVADGTSRIMVFNVNPATINSGESASFVLGAPDFTTQNINCDETQNLVCAPWGLSFDQNHSRLFMSEGNRVLVFNTASIANGEPASYVLGEQDFTSFNSAADNGDAADAKSFSASGITYDSKHDRLFVQDREYSRILMFNVSPGTIANNEDASAVLGQTSLTTPAVPPDFSNGCPTPDQTSYCDGNAVDDAYDPLSNRLYVTDTGQNRVMIFDFARLAGSAPGGATGSAYNFSSGAYSQGTASYSLASGSLPPGLSLNSSSGIVSGTPTTPGNYSFTLALADDNGPIGAFNDSQGYSVAVTGSGGGSSGSGSSSSASSSSASSSPSTSPVDLDKQPPYSDGSGYVSEASSGQEYSFTDNVKGEHTIVVQQITDNQVRLGLDSSTISLQPGDTATKDVDNDGHNDISINLKSIDGGKASLVFKKIIFAIAPGGQTSSGFGAGNSPAKASPGFLSRLLRHIPQALLLVFPWLLFILLGLSVARLTYLSLQEKRLADGLARQLQLEKTLSEEKHNFVTLSSHYLRTPITAITNGIDLMAALGGDSPASTDLKELGQRLDANANELINQASYRAPAELNNAPAGIITPAIAMRSAAAGFIQISSMRVMVFALAASFSLVGVTDYILRRVDLYNVGLVNYLTQLAGLLVVVVLFYASLRSYHKRKQLRQQAEMLLNQQHELETGRNLLVKNSLAVLQEPLGQLKAKLQANLPTNPDMAKPALEGVTQLEALINKFTILGSLESGKMGTVHQPLELSQLINQISGRYRNVLQSRSLNLKTDVPSLSLNQDPLLLTFVIDSLLSNAIKYSPQGGEIQISSRQSRSGSQIFVRDNGPGVDQAKQAQLFQPFSRAEDAAQDFDRPGAGLSLYLDKLVMQYLGGQISIDSQSGRGTTMNLSLPA